MYFRARSTLASLEMPGGAHVRDAAARLALAIHAAGSLAIAISSGA